MWRNIVTHKNCLEQVSLKAPGASYPGQISSHSSMIRHKEDWKKEDKLQRVMLLKGQLAHWEPVQDQPAAQIRALEVNNDVIVHIWPKLLTRGTRSLSADFDGV